MYIFLYAERELGKLHFSQAKNRTCPCRELTFPVPFNTIPMDPNPLPIGRPKAGPAERKNKVTAAFTDAEFLVLQEKSAATKIKMSKLVSQFAVSGQVVGRFTDEQKEIILGLKKLYNSVNQINKAMNFFMKNNDKFRPEKELETLRKLTASIDIIIK